MSDLVGTVRREEHEAGWSIWVLVHRAVVEWIGSSPVTIRNPEWLCIASSAVGNCGHRIAASEPAVQGWAVIGEVPGIEAERESS